jgi:hypothetical protein
LRSGFPWRRTAPTSAPLVGNATRARRWWPGPSAAKPGRASRRASLTLDRAADHGALASTPSAIVARSPALICVKLPGGIAVDHAALRPIRRYSASSRRIALSAVASDNHTPGGVTLLAGADDALDFGKTRRRHLLGRSDSLGVARPRRRQQRNCRRADGDDPGVGCLDEIMELEGDAAVSRTAFQARRRAGSADLCELARDRLLGVTAHADDEGEVEFLAIPTVEPL